MTTEPDSSGERLQPASRSEEDDSDDSGVIKDVAKTKSDVSNNGAHTTAESVSEDDGGPELGRAKTPKKEPGGEREAVTFSPGDLVWARTATSIYYPSVVTQDPHFKFHTKIVKSEPGHHIGGSETAEAHRQYHVQYLGENKRLWLPRSLIIPYKGMSHYEKLAMDDFQNVNKIYKPKTEASKAAWRDAVLIAQRLESLDCRERINECEVARAMERGGEKAAQKKFDLERQQRSSQDTDKQQERFKSPTSSARRSSESDDKKKSYRMKDELAYKMSKMSESERERKKRKSGGEKKPEVVKPIPFNLFDSATPTFNRSFKIKQVKPVDSEDNIVLHKSEESEGGKSPVSAGYENGSSNTKKEKSLKEDVDLAEDVKTNQDSDLKEEAKQSALSEGSLVWAKQRVMLLIVFQFCQITNDSIPMQGYPYWPAVVTRDPDEGEYVKMPQSDSPHSQFKSQRKLHVLFLEYNNQRAWLPGTACYNYQGRNQFEEEATKAGERRKKDFQPGKRYQSQYERAVEYSESLLELSNEERLESVFQKYGWVMVTEQGLPADLATTAKSKKRKIGSEAEFEATKSTDSEVDTGPGPNTPPTMHRLNSSDRRSSAETAETRLDPGVDNVETSVLPRPPPASATPASKKKRESSLVAAIALNGDSSSDENASDSEAAAPSNSSKIVAATASTASTEGAHNNKSCNVQSVSGAVKQGEEEFPRMGDLVWGRMSGFPFWPSFVTRSPQGLCKKPGPNGKQSYHVQFFNWNDESGWVNAVLEFDGLDSFKKIAGKIFPGKVLRPNNNCGLFCSQEEIRQVV